MDYSIIAPIYDFVVRIVFGKSLFNAQVCFLNNVKNGQTVLIVGGGTGQLLSHFDQSDLTIDYVEPSRAMIKQAQKRIIQQGVVVKFHLCEIQKHRFDQEYDVVICPFVLDVFTEVQLREVIPLIKSKMKPSAILLVSDFEIVDNQYWQKWLSKSMHFFFHWLTGLQNKELLPIDAFVRANGFTCFDTKCYYKSFIFSRKYIV